MSRILFRSGSLELPCNRQCAWEKLAWPSKKNLLSEFMDMLRRIAQLSSWSEDLVTPQCVWLPGLFNPTAYLTAVMQVSVLHGRPLLVVTFDTRDHGNWLTVFVLPD